MRRIDDDINTGQFKKVYLLYGQEDYLKKQYRDKLIRALVNDGDTMNFAKFDNDSINIGQMIDLAETMPFFADHRVLLISDSGWGKKTPEEMANYLDLASLPEATIFIFVETEVDKRSKLFKVAKELSRDIEMNKPDERTLALWVGNKLKAYGKQMKKEAWSEFLNRTSESMYNMDSELEKLVSYVGDRKQIELEDVKLVCTQQVEAKIFDLINAMAAKDLKSTMDLYNDMLSAKEPPMRILYMIVRQFRQMKTIKELASHGENAGTIAKKVGAPEFAVNRSVRLMKNFSDRAIRELLDDACDFEYRVKSGRLDEFMAVELLIAKYTS